MSTEPKLEQYLTALDRALGQISVSDRAEIVTEIKSHILEAKERDLNQDLGQILASLGEPESVANRYLIERGLKPGSPSKSPIVKWLTIGFLGTFGLCLLTFVLLIWKFTPIIKVDDVNGRVTLLGGLIDVHEGSGNLNIGGRAIPGLDRSRNFDGSAPVEKSKFEKIHVRLSNAKIEVAPSTDGKAYWTCEVQGGKDSEFISQENRVFMFRFDKIEGSKCKILTPAGISVQIEGVNGKVEIFKPQASIDVKFDNAKISLTPDPKQKYRFDIHVTNGIADSFTSSDANDAIPVKLVVGNGKISRD